MHPLSDIQWSGEPSRFAILKHAGLAHSAVTYRPHGAHTLVALCRPQVLALHTRQVENVPQGGGKENELRVPSLCVNTVETHKMYGKKYAFHFLLSSKPFFAPFHEYLARSTRDVQGPALPVNVRNM